MATRIQQENTKGGIEFKSVKLASDLGSSYIGIDNIMNDLNISETRLLDEEAYFTKLINAVSIDWNGAMVPKVCALFSGDRIIDKISTDGINDTSEFLYILDLLVKRAVSLRQPAIKNNTNQPIQLKINNVQTIQVPGGTSYKFTPPSDTYSIQIKNGYPGGKWKINYGSTSTIIDTVDTTIDGISARIKEIGVYSTVDSESYQYVLSNNTGRQITLSINGVSYTLSANSTQTIELNTENASFVITSNPKTNYTFELNGSPISAQQSISLSNGDCIITEKQVLFEYTITNSSDIACKDFMIWTIDTPETNNDSPNLKYTRSSFTGTEKFVMSSNKVYIKCNLPSGASANATWSIGDIQIHNTKQRFTPGSYSLTYASGEIQYAFTIKNSTGVSITYNIDSTEKTIGNGLVDTYRTFTKSVSFKITNPQTFTTYTINNGADGTVNVNDSGTFNQTTITMPNNSTAKQFEVKATKEIAPEISAMTSPILLVRGTSYTDTNEKCTLIANGNDIISSYVWTSSSANIKLTTSTSNTKQCTAKVNSSTVTKAKVTVTVTGKTPLNQTAEQSCIIYITTLNVSGIPAAMKVGDTSTISVSLTQPDSTYSITSVTYTSDNPSVASVDSTGKITALATTNTPVNIQVQAKIKENTYTLNTPLLINPADEIDEFKFYMGYVDAGSYEYLMQIEDNDELVSILRNVEFETLQNFEKIYELDSSHPQCGTFTAKGITYSGVRKVPVSSPCYIIMPKEQYNKFANSPNAYTKSGEKYNLILQWNNPHSTIMPFRSAIKTVILDGIEYIITGWASIIASDAIFIKADWNISTMFN